MIIITLMLILIIIIINLNYFNGIIINSTLFEICSEPIFRNNNINPDIYLTMYNCINNITDALDPPSYLDGYGPVETFQSFQFNNMVSLSELEGTVTLDMFWRIYWVDQRLYLPNFWTALNKTKPLLLQNGVELKDMIRSQTPLNVWLPDLFMTTGKEVLYLDESIRLRPSGLMFWARHVVATLQQNQFEYAKYPEDTQKILVGVESFAFKNNLLNLSFTPSCGNVDCIFVIDGITLNILPPVIIINSDNSDGLFSPLWTYVSNMFYVDFYDPITPNYSRLVIEINVLRESGGIVYRLAFPIMLLLLLVGLSFWGEHAGRVDTTITILLAVSALYIVIFSSIPMLGYLTIFDYYILSMYLLIVGVIFVHSLCDRLLTKADKLPLRILYTRTIELIGKVCIMPIVLLIFLNVFPGALHKTTRTGYTVFFIVVAIYVFSREYVGFNNSVKDVLIKLRTKIENPASNSISNMELFTFNILFFGIISRSPAHYHKWKRDSAKALEKEEHIIIKQEDYYKNFSLQNNNISAHELELQNMTENHNDRINIDIESNVDSDDEENVTHNNNNIIILEKSNSATNILHQNNNNINNTAGYEL